MKLLFIVSFLTFNIFINADITTEHTSLDEAFDDMVTISKPKDVVVSLQGHMPSGKSTAEIGYSAIAQTMEASCPAPEAIADLADMNRVNANEFARFRSCFMDKKVKAIKRNERAMDDDSDVFAEDGVTEHDVHLQEYKMYVASPWFVMHRFICGSNEKCWLTVLNNHKCFSATMRGAIRRCARRILRQSHRK